MTLRETRRAAAVVAVLGAWLTLVGTQAGSVWRMGLGLLALLGGLILDAAQVRCPACGRWLRWDSGPRCAACGAEIPWDGGNSSI